MLFFVGESLCRSSIVEGKTFARLSAQSGAAAMDEGRKRVLLIAASILAARKLAQHEPGSGAGLRYIVPQRAQDDS
jgi:hypothetical protein